MLNPVTFAIELVHRGWEFLIHEMEHHPMHVLFDAIMVIAVIYVLRMPVHKAKDPAKEKPTKEEEEELIAAFQSAPFEIPDREDLPDAPVVASYKGVVAVLEDGREVLNCSSFDFLAYATEASVIETAQDTIVRYGCGSCGPRGFYGSLKPHLDLEARLAQFMKTQAGIIYSFSFATISTLIPCFSARGDEILADAECHLAIQIGCRLSRSNAVYFRHNDTAHLEELMKESHKRQKAKGKRQPPRRTVIIEGIYRNSGCMAQLAEIVRLAKTYKYRVILDDSLAFAAVGKTGRGTPEVFDIPIADIDIYVGAMSTSLGAVGGFCVGASAMVDHQRLAATGYVFSASLPPYASAAAVRILDMIDEDPARVLALQRNAASFRQFFLNNTVTLPPGVRMMHDELSAVSPVVHFAVEESGPSAKAVRPRLRQQLFAAAQELLDGGIMATAMKYNDQERVEPAPSLRVTVKSEFSKADLEKIARSTGLVLAKHMTGDSA
jgi:serine palmitoyltransferase